MFDACRDTSDRNTQLRRHVNRGTTVGVSSLNNPDVDRVQTGLEFQRGERKNEENNSKDNKEKEAEKYNGAGDGFLFEDFRKEMTMYKWQRGTK